MDGVLSVSEMEGGEGVFKINVPSWNLQSLAFSPFQSAKPINTVHIK